MSPARRDQVALPVRLEHQKAKTGRVGGPTQPVSRLAPLEA